MRRRDFLQLASSAAAAWPLPALSQRASHPALVAVLTPGNADWARERLDAIRKGLQEAGLTEGVHYTLAVRFAEGQMDRLPGLVKELEAMEPQFSSRAARSLLSARNFDPTSPSFSLLSLPTPSNMDSPRATLSRAEGSPATY